MPDPTSPPSLPRPKAAGLIAQADHTVRLARALADAGRTVDLAGLDQLVGVACAQALDLPPNEGRALRPQLAALLGACEALRAVLTASPLRQKAEPCPSLLPLP